MAVYTHVGAGELAGFLDAYQLGRVVSFRGILDGIENTNYWLDTETGRFVLTVFEKRVTATDLPFFLSLMAHLAARGVPCPLPVRRRDGTTFGSLCGRPAAIVTVVPGRSPDPVTPRHCAAIGATLARLHLAGRDFPDQRPNDLSVTAWPALFARSADRADQVGAGWHDLIAGELDALAAGWPRQLPCGVIHADLFPDNSFFDDPDTVTGVIDFYFAATDLFAYDLAVSVVAWCVRADGTLCPGCTDALVAGYARVRPLTAAERAALPVLARGATMRFLLTRLADWLDTPPGALVRPKDPRDLMSCLVHLRSDAAAALLHRAGATPSP